MGKIKDLMIDEWANKYIEKQEEMMRSIYGNWPMNIKAEIDGDSSEEEEGEIVVAREYQQSILDFITEPGHSCKDNLIPYTGLVEAFNHCEVCGKKEDEI